MGLSLKMQSSAVPTSAACPLPFTSPLVPSIWPAESPPLLLDPLLLHPLLPLGTASVLGTVPPCPVAQVPERFLRGVPVWGVKLGGQRGLRYPLGAATWENGVEGCRGVLTTLGMCTPGRVPGSGVHTWWAHPSVRGRWFIPCRKYLAQDVPAGVGITP